MLGVAVAAATASAIGVAQFRGHADTYRQQQLWLAELQGTLYKIEGQQSTAELCPASGSGQGKLPAALAGIKQQLQLLRNYGDPKLQEVTDAVDTYVRAKSQCNPGDNVQQAYSIAEAKLSDTINERDVSAQQSIWRSEIEACLGLLAFVVSLAMILWRMGVARHGANIAEAKSKVLESSERKLRTLTEKSSDILLVLDESGATKHVGSSIRGILGYAADAVYSLFDILDADDRTPAMEALKVAASQEGRSHNTELRFCHADSTPRIFDVTITNCLHVDSVDGLVLNGHDITERKRSEERLRYDAFHDSLTDLPNRTVFCDRLQRAVNRARRDSSYCYAVLFIDVDRFKLVNDSLGHTAGDELLVQVASRLRNCIRQTTPDRKPAGDDSVSRYAGDEFTILIEELREAVDATRVAERILAKFQSPFTLQGAEIFVSVSVGIAIGNRSYRSDDEVLRDADIAMYRSKVKGGNRFQIFDPGMHLAAQNRLRMESDLRRAIEQNQFQVLLQPIVHIDDGRVHSVEALLRWHHPEIGLIPPLDFLPVAEDTGLIVPIGRYVMREACRQLQKLQDSCPDVAPRAVAVNLSAREFAEPDLVENIKAVLKDVGLPGPALRIEITETVAMTNVERVDATLRQIKQLGVGISIDDFGTGYSSLSYLKRFPIDVLKIDRSFVSTIDQDTESREIIRTILKLAASLQMKAVAEGIETASQIAVLRSIGCEYAQGYYYSKPVTPEAVEARLHASYDTAVMAKNSIQSADLGGTESTVSVATMSR